jgi:hypothetical protein
MKILSFMNEQQAKINYIRQKEILNAYDFKVFISLNERFKNCFL